MHNRFTQPESAVTNGMARPSQEFSRILTAAVINAQFRQLLLTNPGKAIEAGYCGERFDLAREEKTRVSAIRATNLADFASQLSQAMMGGD